MEPAEKADDTADPGRSELRRQILMEKGVTLADVAGLAGPERLLLDARIEAEIARRRGQRLLDLRV